ncbi:unnamed protein product [Amoebophrya sp. A120]|nr:unnamed protein product [Amoebophrya sp. A120]|eukprot:GSA120T00018272001.1
MEDKLLCVDFLDCIDRESRRGDGDTALCVFGMWLQAASVTYISLAVFSANRIASWTPGARVVDFLVRGKDERLQPHPLFLLAVSTLSTATILSLHFSRNSRLRKNAKTSTGNKKSSQQLELQLDEGAAMLNEARVGEDVENLLRPHNSTNVARAETTSKAEINNNSCARWTPQVPRGHPGSNNSTDQNKLASPRPLLKIFGGCFTGSAVFCLFLDTTVPFAYPTLSVFAAGAGILAYLSAVPTAREGVARDLVQAV